MTLSGLTKLQPPLQLRTRFRTNLGICLGGWALATGCSTSGSTLSQVVYTAFGDSTAIGYNASVSCDAPANANGTPPLVSDPLDCPNGTGYVPQIARSLAQNPNTVVSLTNLGLNGSVVGPQIQSLSSTIPANVLTQQLPSLPANSTLITLFVGGNDVVAITTAAQTVITNGEDINAFLQTQISTFATEYGSLVQGIRTQAPNAQLVVSNLPNLAYIPSGASQSQPIRLLLSQLSVAFSQQVINPLAQTGVKVVDLLCNAAVYEPTAFFPGPFADGFHPNDSGYTLAAQLFVPAIQSGSGVPPQTSCSPYSDPIP